GDGFVLAVVTATLVWRPADIEWVGKNPVKVPPAERCPSRTPSIAHCAQLGSELQSLTLLLQSSDTAELEVELKKQPDRLSFLGIDAEFAIDGVVTERHGTAHPHALLLGGCDLVADALARDLPLELGEGEQHVQGEPPHGGVGIELLRHRDEGDALGIKSLHDLGQVE